MMKQKILIFLIAIVFISCNSYKKQYELKSLEGYNVLMTDSFDINKNPVADSIFNFYKDYVAVILDSVVGYNKVFMDKGLREESLLGNFAADAVAAIADEIFDTKVDMGLMNRGGLRTSLPKGDVTLGNIYKVFPFDNYITLIELKGSDLKKLLETFTKTHFQCISRVEVVVKNKKLVSALIDGEPIDDNKIYKIGTIDFIAEGNDNMRVLKNCIGRTDSQVLVRDAIAKYVKEKSVIDSKKDGRISFN